MRQQRRPGAKQRSDARLSSPSNWYEVRTRALLPPSLPSSITQAARSRHRQQLHQTSISFLRSIDAEWRVPWVWLYQLARAVEIWQKWLSGSHHLLITANHPYTAGP